MRTEHVPLTYRQSRKEHDLSSRLSAKQAFHSQRSGTDTWQPVAGHSLASRPRKGARVQWAALASPARLASYGPGELDLQGAGLGRPPPEVSITILC